jgi:hypothetical protein
MALIEIISFELFKCAYFDEFSAQVNRGHHNVISVADFRAESLEPVFASV